MIAGFVFRKRSWSLTRTAGLLGAVALSVGAGATAGQPSSPWNGQIGTLGFTSPPEIPPDAPSSTTQPGVRWTSKQVEFRDGPAVLKGTIYTPEGESRFPGVVILGGSERGPRTRLKERLAEHIAGAGVGVLIYDSAGMGQSTGNALFQTRAARAEEAIAAVRCLRSETSTRPDRVGVLGISEGALVSMLAAARDDSIAFAIPVSGGFGMSMMELARYRIEVQGLARKLKPEEIQRALLLEELLFALLAGPDVLEWRLIDMKAAQWPDEAWVDLAGIVKTVRQAASAAQREEQWDSLRAKIKSFRAEPWFDLVVVNLDRFDRFLAMSAPQFYAFIEQGPLAAGDFEKVRQEMEQLSKVRCPVLAIWGENDDFLPPHRSAAFLKDCLSRAGHKDATFRVVTNADHNLARGGDNSHFAGEFLDVLTEWLSRRYASKPSGDK